MPSPTNRPMLQSVYMTQILWPYRQPLQAICTAREVPHKTDAPDDNCACGIYAFKNREAVEQSDERHVTGQVALWGQFVEHALGWRVELAYPLELWIPSGSWEYAEALGETYGVPVHVKQMLRVR